jgi:hypothetical protein
MDSSTEDPDPPVFRFEIYREDEHLATFDAENGLDVFVELQEKELLFSDARELAAELSTRKWSWVDVDDGTVASPDGTVFNLGKGSAKLFFQHAITDLNLSGVASVESESLGVLAASAQKDLRKKVGSETTPSKNNSRVTLYGKARDLGGLYIGELNEEDYLSRSQKGAKNKYRSVFAHHRI